VLKLRLILGAVLDSSLILAHTADRVWRLSLILGFVAVLVLVQVLVPIFVLFQHVKLRWHAARGWWGQGLSVALDIVFHLAPLLAGILTTLCVDLFTTLCRDPVGTLCQGLFTTHWQD